jgi:hypothetical protein
MILRVFKTLLAVAGAVVLAGALAAPASAAIIYPVSANGSSSYPGYPDADAIDQGAGSDVSDWASLGQGASSFLNLDLGAVYTLDQAFVTDRVTSGGGNNGYVGGLSDFTTQFSLQGFTNASFTTAIGSALVFNHTAPIPSGPSSFGTTVALGGLTTQFVRYQVLATNGSNPGLSDIHFATRDGGVPEPATWGLMLIGFGGMGAILRRRRAAALAA